MKPFVSANLRPVLEGRKILLGISGGIAAFKACDVVRQLRACGAEVRVVLTDNARQFVTPVTLETLSGQSVLSSLFDEHGAPRQNATGTHHIETARWADLALIAPATANTIGKLALGLADDLLSTELLAFTGPVCVAPAMNPAMYAHPAVQANLATLAGRGVFLLGPASGATACGEEGLGRMLEAHELVEAVATRFFAHAEARNGRTPRVLLTLGPTRSAIDPVRYVTNRSSGLMGAAIAWAAARAGFNVTAVCGPTDVPLPAGTEVIRVETAGEMARAALERWSAADLFDVFIGAAAVLDWDVANPSRRKLKKEAADDSNASPRLEFARNEDIVAAAARTRRPGQLVIAFAAETENALANARAKLATKGCDAIFVNDVSLPELGFESTRNAGWWITAAGGDAVTLAPQSKIELAAKLVGLIEALRFASREKQPDSASLESFSTSRGPHEPHTIRL